MSELRKAAQAALDVLGNVRSVDRLYALDTIDRLRAALAEPETEAQPVAWRKPDGAICTDAYKASCWKDKGPVEPLYTHPPSDAWRPASEPTPPFVGMVVCPLCGNKRCPHANDRELACTNSNALGQSGSAYPTHLMEVTPPTTEGAIAAKCQRIEGSGEICGLTPPCPDCGSSLIDVPEGAF